MNVISLAELRARMSGGLNPVLLDVRTPGEFARMHAAGARSMPLDQLNAASVAAECRSSDGHIYVICHSGTRASMACRQLLDAGIPDVSVVEGGTQAWESAGLPVVRSSSGVISLERQVRIAAGSLVLLGCVLAWLAAPQFILLSAFVGAGLAFAGITDICGMAILLGKLPWNSRGGDSARC
ncbi:MAG TPA: rhodanese-like domain-containing protein [Acidobacteriaceae bacterium]|nr:rhodanese-like domain-containing protein [Acidobacteriaceae bacterium]